MRSLRLVLHFIRASFQEEAAYRANFLINLFYSLVNLGTGILGLVVVFGQVQQVQGWDLHSTLALLGVYLLVSALRGLFIGPALESLAGMDGEIWTGKFDYTLLRPVNTQFLVSLRRWQLFALTDLVLAAVIIVIAAVRMQADLTLPQVLLFLLMLLVGLGILYAILLVFAALVFWSPGMLFTWIFNGLFQMARYPLGMYPNWLRLVLTWIVPVGLITTIPVEALRGSLELATVLLSLVVAAVLIVGASLLFRAGLRRYKSASS